MTNKNTRKLLIQQGIFDYNMNTTAAGMDESKAMDEAVAYFEALLATQKQRWSNEAQRVLLTLYQPEITDLQRNEYQGLNKPVIYLAAALDGVIGEETNV